MKEHTKLFLTHMLRQFFLQNCFMKRAIVLRNNIPESVSKTKNSYETIKTKLKQHFISQIKKETEHPVQKNEMLERLPFLIKTLVCCLHNFK